MYKCKICGGGHATRNHDRQVSVCKCHKCGKTFEQDSYSALAEFMIDKRHTCPECRRKGE